MAGTNPSWLGIERLIQQAVPCVDSLGGYLAWASQLLSVNLQRRKRILGTVGGTSPLPLFVGQRTTTCFNGVLVPAERPNLVAATGMTHDDNGGWERAVRQWAEALTAPPLC